MQLKLTRNEAGEDPMMSASVATFGYPNLSVVKPAHSRCASAFVRESWRVDCLGWAVVNRTPKVGFGHAASVLARFPLSVIPQWIVAG